MDEESSNIVLDYLYSNPSVKRVELLNEMIEGIKKLYTESNSNSDISNLAFRDLVTGISKENLTNKVSSIESVTEEVTE